MKKIDTKSLNLNQLKLSDCLCYTRVMSILPTPSSPPKSAEVQLPFTQMQSPSPLAKWKVRVLSGKIHPSPPPRVREKLEESGAVHNVVYRIMHTITRRRYYGSTQNVKKRFSVYKSHLNASGKNSMHIENAIKRSPDKFTVAIVQRLPEATLPELHQCEEEWVQEYGTLKRENGYNHALPTANDGSPAFKRPKIASNENPLPRTAPSRSASIKSKSLTRQLFKEESVSDISTQP
jgi:hypothetical protein